jgi:hypothetical protein
MSYANDGELSVPVASAGSWCPRESVSQLPLVCQFGPFFERSGGHAASVGVCPSRSGEAG